MSGLIRVVLDWETAYGRHPVTDENITLSRMTTEEYVRHKHFKAHGLGVKIGRERAFYVYGPDLLAFLRSHPWDRTFAIAHHAHFDGAIFSWRAGIRPAFIGDTLSMARAIYPHESHSLARLSILTGAGEKGHELQHFQGKWALTRQEQAVLGGYCCNDVELTAYIFNHLLSHFSVDEMRNIDWTVRAFTEPVIEVDPAPLIEAYKSERRRKRKLIKQCVSDKTELASNDKFAALLLSLGVDPPKKVSPAKVKDGRVDPDEVGDPPLGILPSFKAPKGASPEERVQLKETKATYPWSYAFGKADEDFKLLQDHPDPQVQAVVEARLGVKSTIKETRTKRFYKIGSRGAFPVYLNYYGGHTGRWSGGDKQNAQNLNRVDDRDPTSGALRMSWVAPKGHVFVVRDLGQIECRKLTYLAGQEDMLDMFREGGDPYDFMATKIYGRVVDRKNVAADKNPGQVGKIVVLGAGFQMGAWKLQGNVRVGFMGMPGILFGQEYVDQLGVNVEAFLYQRSYKKGFATAREEADACKPLNVSAEDHYMHCAVTKFLIDKFRAENDKVVLLWKEAQNALELILSGKYGVQVGDKGLVHTCEEGFVLPNGMKIRYYGLRKSSDGKSYKYLANARKKEWTNIYGGKEVENCIAAGTKVLTDSGWKNIENVSIYDLVHDGIDFVRHGGSIPKGLQDCTLLDGVGLTPDHEVFTNEGWSTAASVAVALEEPGLYRPDIRCDGGGEPCRFGWQEEVVGVSLQMRPTRYESSIGCGERSEARGNSKLWLHDGRADVEAQYPARNEQAPGICGVAVNVGSVPLTHSPSVEELRGAGDSGVRKVAGVVRELLGRHGSHLCERVLAGSGEQRWPVLPGELRVGDFDNPEQEQKNEPVYRDPERADDCVGSRRRIWGRENHVIVPHGQGVHRRGASGAPQELFKQEVYDIINCGPLSRFVVLGDSGPFIVHNCVQALSRIVLSDQMLRISRNLKEGYVLRHKEVAKVVSSTHDEAITIVPERYASDCLYMMGEEMRTPPDWCKDIPLKSSGGFARSYGACEK